MKKLLSLVCVLALALALCVPAFAEDATSGQVTGTVHDDAASTNGQVFTEQVAITVQNPTVENGLQLAADVKANPSQNVTWQVAQAMGKVLVQNGEKEVKTIEEGITITSYKQSGSGTLSLSMTLPANNSLSIEGNVDGEQSALGYYIEFTVPAGKMDQAKRYMWINDKNEFGEVDYYTEYVNGEYVRTYFFYAPHFSRYDIAVASDILARLRPVAAANNNSPFAATNSNMNQAAVVIAAFVMGLTVLSAVELKKRSLSK